MIKEYVTIAELKQHMKVDFDYEDEYIKGLIIPAQLAIESYINKPLLDCEDSRGDIDRRIWHAIRIMVSDYYNNRESVVFATPNELPILTILLQPLKLYK